MVNVEIRYWTDPISKPRNVAWIEAGKAVIWINDEPKEIFQYNHHRKKSERK